MQQNGLLFLIQIFIITLSVFRANGQVATGQSDRTQQELALLGWTAGVRMAYCQPTSIHDLIEPFKESIARMLNRHCRIAAACGLKKSVTFNKYQVVILDGFPRREHRALSFRFFVVLPHDAIPMEKRPDKPLLSSLYLSDMLDSQMAELTHGLGWQILSYEKYPRFDPTTTFFNRSLIPIAIVVGLCMIFLAYWVNSLTSGSSLYADGWLVRGSSGGKNAALRRTMEIIEEQKYRFALYDSQKGTAMVHVHQGAIAPPRTVVLYKSNARVQEVQAPPKSLATSYSSPQTTEASRAMPIYPAPDRIDVHRAVAIPMPTKDMSARINGKDKPLSTKDNVQLQHQRPEQFRHQLPTVAEESSTIAVASRKTGPKISLSSSSSSEASAPKQRVMPANDVDEEAEMADCVPEIVVMHARDSVDTVDTAMTPGGGRKLSSTQGRKSRRFSIAEEFKRRKSFFGGPGKERGGRSNKGDQHDRIKRWQASSIALSKFSVVGSGGR